MDWLTLLLVLTALAGSISGVVAWVAKIRWSQEYREAKEAQITTLEAQIKTKEAQITSLEAQIHAVKEQKDAQVSTLNDRIQLHQDMSSVKLREFYLSTKSQLEEIIGDLQRQLEITQTELDRERTLTGRLNERLIQALEAEKERLAVTSRSAERLLGNLAAQVHHFAPIQEMPEAQEGGTAIADWVSWLLHQERGGLAFGNSGSANDVVMHFNTQDGKRSRLTIRAVSRSGLPALEVRCGGDCPPGWGKPRQGIAHLLPPLVQPGTNPPGRKSGPTNPNADG
ncbi:MAG: hypothetical protein ACR2H9_14595 [Longimicrobiaceae bacterium]|jgi:hypothetical protein